MALSLLFAKVNPGQIGELLLDATLQDNHSYDNEVTQFPIEDGADITDNIRRVPDRVTITGFVTNTPIAFLQFLNFGLVRNEGNGKLQGKNLSSGETKSRVQTSFETLLAISGRSVDGKNPDPQIVEIVTGLRVYRNMVMESLEIPRDAQNSKEQLRFTATFLQISRVNSQSITLPNVSDDIKNQASSVTDKKKATTTEASAEKTTRSSLILKALRTAKRAF